ncbi:hypothetical protein PILCRDRAFT_639987 [Piloderma croceum F 1598]|uniref:Uncharacterized protein n=1 Tax=Piloderma croceum (strain F 1598) TaxID=765440 RepID=A0A0C3BH83_PILCF|nr:hypothetical protein PILCRDRAFT_639987 [Piloderma croceum F 1598]
MAESCHRLLCCSKASSTRGGFFVLRLYSFDVFKSKLPKVPLEKYFPEYTADPDINKAAKYILWRFMQTNRAWLSVYPQYANPVRLFRWYADFLSFYLILLPFVVGKPLRFIFPGGRRIIRISTSHIANKRGFSQIQLISQNATAFCVTSLLINRPCAMRCWILLCRDSCCWIEDYCMGGAV